ncbi:hypothetical protein EQ500_03990, partial [Lactobacillus sp. XV13L]|nr:hypothetical protein [Lactobacillus sp. XV13L]
MISKKASFLIVILSVLFSCLLIVTSTDAAITNPQTITTSIPDLQALPKKVNKIMPKSMPDAADFLKPGVSYPDNPYDNKDLMLVKDDNTKYTSYTAYVYTIKGLMEAIWDPASPSWDFNINNPTDKQPNKVPYWKQRFLNGYLNLDVGIGAVSTKSYLPQSQIHTIVLQADMDIT